MCEADMVTLKLLTVGKNWWSKFASMCKSLQTFKSLFVAIATNNLRLDYLVRSCLLNSQALYSEWQRVIHQVKLGGLEIGWVRNVNHSTNMLDLHEQIISWKRKLRELRNGNLENGKRIKIWSNSAPVSTLFALDLDAHLV